MHACNGGRMVCATLAWESADHSSLPALEPRPNQSARTCVLAYVRARMRAFARSYCTRTYARACERASTRAPVYTSRVCSYASASLVHHDSSTQR
eukprot:2507785-Pleurochrysis_carterae.AAC.1